ncbi:sigma-70 family RNA polymerase sigma factor [Solihabitans fulvus]|uniref:Sigma-70 family RNA polymerase sigma factor n=1 Tax=Solihabitans fulvus TaxID=1892852 RepID=A0A5B2XEN0_9PSEU|nr:sigma-70 family RNA polymerase sigma factor [Solihabitans fulvus]KAA2261505.1 sigma-70 family RNA polymerase sigma factor [Solihabitans fulvus]
MSTRRLLTALPQPANPAPRMDNRVLADLARQHAPVLLRYVTRLTFNDPHLAEDIVQETLFRAWQHPQTLTTQHASIRPWLFTVARNLVHDHRRSRHARQVDYYGTECDLPRRAAVAANPAESVVEHQAMLVALGRLSAQHREVVVQLYYLDRSLADAARVLGVPVGTVKSRAYYALRALRLALDEPETRSSHAEPLRQVC